MTAPYVHTKLKRDEDGKDWAIALLPILIWSVFMFGARVITICVIAAAFGIVLDFLVRRFIFKYDLLPSIDIMAPVYCVLAVFTMPVTIPLWIPMVSSVLVILAKNIRLIWKRRLFNPFVFSAAVMHIAFSDIMLRFTRPFAYFSAFSFNISPALIDNYRVITPLQYMADGSVYEDGVFAQLYGFASGNMGEIAVAAIFLAAVWLFVRKQASPLAVISMLLPVLVLGLLFPSDDAESNFYAYSLIMTGAIIFLSVFGLSERQTVPMSTLGKVIFGAVCGCVIFVLRKLDGGTEWGYVVLLVLNILSPFIEMITKPKPVGYVRR